MKIEIWSDIACPYCYIGKRKLEKALEQFPHKDKVELVWHSYELDPDLPKKATKMSVYSYFAKKHEMSDTEAHETVANISKLANESGLHYDYDKLIVANTSDALRLAKLANKWGLATEAEEVLFDAYFSKGKDVSDKDTLVSLGVNIGLKEDDIIEMLESDTYINDIKEDIEYSENSLNLEYIPFYQFNNDQIIQGSVAEKDYLSVLSSAYQAWEKGETSEKNGEIITGQSCSIDGICS